MRLSQMLTCKFAEVVVLGRSLAPARAREVIRRTDMYFQHDHRLPAGGTIAADRDYFSALDDALNYPSARRLAALSGIDEAGAHRLVGAWRRRWQVVGLQWLGNTQVWRGEGFCHADGSVAGAWEISDYPTGPELLDDLRRIAMAFPDLTMDVAVWCSFGTSMLGFPMLDALETAWPPELSSRVAVPTVGFLVGGGKVTPVRGFDRRLFAGLGLNYRQAAERALAETRRLAGLAGVEFGLRPARCPRIAGCRDPRLDRDGPRARSGKMTVRADDRPPPSRYSARKSPLGRSRS